jgi:hypothetical protein
MCFTYLLQLLPMCIKRKGAPHISLCHVASALILSISETCECVQGQAASDASLLDRHSPVASYELRDLPGRRLRRKPRRTYWDSHTPAACTWDMPH